MLRELVWLSLVGPELQGDGRIRKAVSYGLNPDTLGSITSQVVVWLPRLVAAEAMGQNSIVVYGLAIVHMHI